MDGLVDGVAAVVVVVLQPVTLVTVGLLFKVAQEVAQEVELQLVCHSVEGREVE
jgi:hypothetical protein